MKKGIFFLLICCMIVSVTGCSKQETGSRETTAPVLRPATDEQGDASATETEIVIHPGQWELSGTLTLPAGKGPFPLVVFVHGSGPSDRDETVGKIKLFKDLASGLAQKGIATIRYDKRTYLYGTEMAADTELTVWEETIEDALFAVAFGKSTDKIDTDNIFVAAHSFGGYLIPRIDQADTEGSIAGYISLAGTARSIMDQLLQETQYVVSLPSDMTEKEKAAQLKEVTDAREAVANLTQADAGSAKLILGAYPTYWLDFSDYKPLEEIGAVEEPMLFLQGEHDFQVTVEDFDLWKAASEGRDNAVFVLYPKLTHTFTETQKMGTPADYYVFAHADPAVAEDMGAFVLDHMR